jgi:cyclopropane fatty-acyl-phospholipid synthase-like methyltransferase
MLRFKMLDDGTLDTLAKCEHCGKVERFDTDTLHEASEDYDGSCRNREQRFRSAIREALAIAGHDSEGCEV